MNQFKVNVLLATFNGHRWLQDQIDSITNQIGCEVFITASDDLSTDLTLQLLNQLSDVNKIDVLDVPEHRFGSANSNFLRLIHDASDSYDYYALSDQDDIWFNTKLVTAIQHLEKTGYDAYSSDVLAFWPTGKKKYIKKSYPIKPYDFLFESAGPGCTFVFPKRTFIVLKSWVDSNYDNLQSAKVHDWLIYAFARMQNMKWYIDNRATMLYRQHPNNDFGANVGFHAAKKRFFYILDGYYRNDILKLATLVNFDASLVLRLRRLTLLDLLYLIFNTHKFRRRKLESIFLKFVFLLMFLGRRNVD